MDILGRSASKSDQRRPPPPTTRTRPFDVRCACVDVPAARTRCRRFRGRAGRHEKVKRDLGLRDLDGWCGDGRRFGICPVSNGDWNWNRAWRASAPLRGAVGAVKRCGCVCVWEIVACGDVGVLSPRGRRGREEWWCCQVAIHVCCKQMIVLICPVCWAQTALCEQLLMTYHERRRKPASSYEPCMTSWTGRQWLYARMHNTAMRYMR